MSNALSFSGCWPQTHPDPRMPNARACMSGVLFAVNSSDVFSFYRCAS
jgi:hypothetical protein